MCECLVAAQWCHISTIPPVGLNRDDLPAASWNWTSVELAILHLIFFCVFSGSEVRCGNISGGLSCPEP